jgi:hypothetical protein
LFQGFLLPVANFNWFHFESCFTNSILFEDEDIMINLLIWGLPIYEVLFAQAAWPRFCADAALGGIKMCFASF